MRLRYECLTDLLKGHPDYDGHAVHGLVNEHDDIVAAAFIHRESKGITLQGGGVAKSGGGARLKLPGAPFAEGLVDGFRLPRGMTQKFAGLDVSLGGGKSVLFGCNIRGWQTNAKNEPELPREIREELWRAFGAEIMTRTRTYVVAEDMGTTPEDMAYLAKHAPSGLVAGCAQATNPSPLTARGLLMGVKATVGHDHPGQPLSDFSFAIQGVGSVGMAFLEMIWNEGVREVYISDTRASQIEKAKRRRDAIRVIAPESIHKAHANVFVPCAGGGIVNEKTISEMSVENFAVAGCANNQLATPEDGQRLHDAGILYGVDYIINAGGAAEVVSELMHASVDSMIKRIPESLRSIYIESDATDRPASVISDERVAGRVALLSLPR